jgi:glutamate-1-semialdehyde 2,1-aminomutase
MTTNAGGMSTVDAGRVADLLSREEKLFVEQHPRSATTFEHARKSLLGGVPMPWMTQWAGPYPVFVDEAHGGEFVDVDGRRYIDLCFGDTGSMTGHSPPVVAEAIARQAAQGITFMLPTEDSAHVAEELGRRFGVPYWQFALTATDANRFTIRTARHITGRPKILVFSWCYHGSVDETLVVLEDGKPRVRPGNVGPPVDPALTTRVVEWNDVEALEAELAHGDVACVLAEPALTNIGIVLPEPGFHDALRRATRDTDTLLVIDETHTFCTGPGGYTAAHGLDPDFVTIGKAIASGLPAAAYGMSKAVAERVERDVPFETADVGGIGGTLSGNALSLAAIRATLDNVLTEEAFEGMIALAKRYEQGVAGVIAEQSLPWHVSRLGCRVEYWFRAEPPRNGGEAAAAVDVDLDRLLHLYALNRGVLMTPFHNMALISPATTEQHVDRYVEIFADAARELLGR